jgi:hypothetical protein
MAETSHQLPHGRITGGRSRGTTPPEVVEVQPGDASFGACRFPVGTELRPPQRVARGTLPATDPLARTSEQKRVRPLVDELRQVMLDHRQEFDREVDDPAAGGRLGRPERDGAVRQLDRLVLDSD